MNSKNKFFIFIIILIILASISFVSACENNTAIEITDVNEMVGNDNSEIMEVSESNSQSNAKIIVKDYNSYYDSGKELVVQVKDFNGNVIEDVLVKINFYSKQHDYSYSDSDGKCYFLVFEKVGSHKATISLDDYNYAAEPIKINVKITKAPTYLSTKKITSSCKSYTTLRATVKDKWGDSIDEGTVTFKVGGKTYKVKVKNGVATKKIKLTKIKTYTYKTIFSSKNYKTKSSSSKVNVKDPKRWHTYKFGKYRFTVSKSQYDKIQYVLKNKNAKNLKKYPNFQVKTNKYYNYKKPIYKTKWVQKTKWVYKTKLAYESWWGDWGYEWKDYYPSTPKGYSWYGTSYRDGDGWSETYYKYKKKITYYETKKVVAGYTTVKLPVHAVVTTYSAIWSGKYVNYPQVQFVAKHGKNTWDWEYLTNHYRIR